MARDDLQADRKMFLGGRLKRLRRELGHTQSRMAADLGVSPSYLNHLERNQRPVTAQVLLRLAQTYDLDLRAFSGDADKGGEADLQEVFADPMFRDLPIPRHEISDLVENAPGAAEAVSRLYRALQDQRRRESLGLSPALTDDGREAGELTPADWVRDYIQAHRNHFPELDALGEALAAELTIGPGFESAAARRLSDAWRIDVRVLPISVMVEFVRRYDPHRRRLLLSEVLGVPARSFAVAYQLGFNEGGEILNSLVDQAAAPDLASQRLLKVSLANYLAAATLMPYAAFHAAAEEMAYDIGLLSARFGASFEQVCHRLTTLSRPGVRGVPFFLIRTDNAGNISKRFASSAFPFSRFGGACPRWNIHASFKAPGRIVTQVVETFGDGARYFTLARTVDRVVGAYGGSDDAELAVGLGCELKYAGRLVYARGLDLARPSATEIGATCRLCERPNCRERAAPPITRTLRVDELAKTVSPFPFAAP
ncbi:MAG: short-chain fatty acyl-CoA regulator family protein [Caulobacteraceae bacterium]|nr:short-chain fatty acyl-CoA regulator family protein [Caulobacteraceae bacterium]